MEFEQGSINISDDVLKEIAFRSFLEVLEITPDDKESKRLKKSVEIERTPEDGVIVYVKTSAPYGKSIVEFGRKIMKNISENIQRMTELQVVAVNVTITDVTETFEELNKEAEETEGEEGQ
ncbi:Asp23/Gls24 family envelope stress response protein [Thermosipho ferrireducens]|uniref:Asp23/Gls24 family envelope stress response protein n=1 Tax=Thermosipho ferrireducens TaxID=2571116 RepID=A0ABX7SAF9_9BACT|nr:Asp23/Gls24 family envelope stress response protein [Thermosipho ferrireducens]QTA38403.1 Asp23/Gls24 family envelope stress response protein [Thermosipho ferrireducens]